MAVVVCSKSPAVPSRSFPEARPRMHVCSQSPMHGCMIADGGSHIRIWSWKPSTCMCNYRPMIAPLMAAILLTYGARSGDGPGSLEAHARLLGQRARRGQCVPHDGLGGDVHPAEEVVPLAVDHPQNAPPWLAHVDNVVRAHHYLRLQESLPRPKHHSHHA